MAIMGLGIKLGVNFFDTAIAYERLRPYYCEDIPIGLLALR